MRQFHGLSDEALCLELSRRLAKTKVENQLGFLLRSARNKAKTDAVQLAARSIRAELRSMNLAENRDSLRGHEGIAGRHYFSALPELLDDSQELMHFSGRSRRPPGDPFNAALSFGYSLLYRDVMAAIICVGLDPALGFLHRPRSAAYPLALDIMELFRVILWDMPLIASVNRKQWNEKHFIRTPPRVWLSDEGRRQAVRLYETRKQERWRHPVLNYSLSYIRAIELEVRLLEKEWSGSPGLFAKMKVR